MSTQSKAGQKEALRQDLAQACGHLWPAHAPGHRPPPFPDKGKAAERLRRLPEYRKARVVVVMPDPVLLQARINTLNDRKTLIAATPGLKQGLVRVIAPDAPMAQRNRLLAANALAKTGRILRFPRAKIGKIDLLIGAALASDEQGRLLGDGRGLMDLVYAILRSLKAMSPQTPVAVLLADEQLVSSIPLDEWDVGADLVVTPTQVYRQQGAHPTPRLDGLPPQLARLPLVKGVMSLLNPS
ncbi:MAG: 5-formyltetrahydrofolate cyclo-ligase [Desulfarculaceae bacterium]